MLHTHAVHREVNKSQVSSGVKRQCFDGTGLYFLPVIRKVNDHSRGVSHCLARQDGPSLGSLGQCANKLSRTYPGQVLFGSVVVRRLSITDSIGSLLPKFTIQSIQFNKLGLRAGPQDTRHSFARPTEPLMSLCLSCRPLFIIQGPLSVLAISLPGRAILGMYLLGTTHNMEGRWVCLVPAVLTWFHKPSSAGTGG